MADKGFGILEDQNLWEQLDDRYKAEMAETAKPCPRCESTRIALAWEPELATARIYCRDCGFTGAAKRYDLRSKHPERAALKAWNLLGDKKCQL